MADPLISDGRAAPVEVFLAGTTRGRAFRFSAGDAVTQPAGGVLALTGSGNSARCNRMPLARADRWLWEWLSRAWDGWRTAVVIVKPETVVASHRQGFR